MTSEENKSPRSLRQRLGAFVIGGAVGLIAGILIATRSGRELRDNLAARAEDAAERGREVYFETQERVQERVSEVGERAPYSHQEPAPVETPIISEPGSAAGTGSEPEADATGESGEPRPRPARSEELLRKIEETRARLREQMEASAPSDSPATGLRPVDAPADEAREPELPESIGNTESTEDSGDPEGGR